MLTLGRCTRLAGILFARIVHPHLIECVGATSKKFARIAMAGRLSTERLSKSSTTSVPYDVLRVFLVEIPLPLVMATMALGWILSHIVIDCVLVRVDAGKGEGLKR